MKVGDTLPALNIKDKGEIYVSTKGKKAYKPWSSDRWEGKRRIVQYLPGRLISGRLNIALNEDVYEVDHPESCRTITIVNASSAILGTQIFIERSILKGKKKTPLCDIIYDSDGLGAKAWELKKADNTTMVINEEGIIEFYYEGKLSKDQILEVIDISTPRK